ncbi:unannotated protein [freshwater metagenome]|uniref:Unannotated protein n=1 Tax=freshwater metagenome TaxID=449393 RepID=A0A6J7RND1_9ZZZZ
MRLRLDIAYDGTAFFGWARQPDLRTVQGVLEAALAVVLRAPESLRVACAGRTDAGVHARGQVTHCDVERDLWASIRARGPLAPLRRLSGVLPEDLRVSSVATAPEGFNARWSAISRTYCYRISDVPGGPDPLLRHHVLQHPGHRGLPLNLDALNEASQILLGENDFAAFCRRRAGASTIRTLQDLRWERDPVTGFVHMWIRADAFCHTMVRSIVGALLPVGDGRRPISWPGQLLAGARRDPDAEVAPAWGLTLEHVGYPEDHELANQAMRARTFRGPDQD